MVEKNGWNQPLEVWPKNEVCASKERDSILRFRIGLRAPMSEALGAAAGGHRCLEEPKSLGSSPLTLFLGRVPLQKKQRYPYSNLSTGGPRGGSRSLLWGRFKV